MRLVSVNVGSARPFRAKAVGQTGIFKRRFLVVVEPGAVQVGQSVRWERFVGEPVTAIEIFETFFANRYDEPTLRRHLAAPIAIRDREAKELRLRELLAARNDGAYAPVGSSSSPR